MRIYDNGSFVGVTVTRKDVVGFRQTWPGSGLPDKPVWFQFDKRTGDLVDMEPADIPDADGAALLALSQDAQAYAEDRGMMYY